MKSKSFFYLSIALATLITACGSQSVPQNLSTPETVIEESTVEVQTSPSYNDEMFASVTICQPCHSGLTDEVGNDVSYNTDLQASMMAQATVDPYYLATISAEVARHPDLQKEIEDKCATCHMSMAHFAVHAEGGTSVIFGENGFLNPQHPLYDAANEAISCTVCHQIEDDNFGTEESFSGGMLFDTSSPKNERILYGPYPTEESLISIMNASSGYIIKESDHLAQSEMCATCHTLHTHYITANGQLSEDTFPEQTPYLEWLASDYANQQSCQDCHMPKAEGSVAISIMSSEARSPFYLHTFTGGNAYMLEILKKFSTELDIQSDSTNFDKAIEQTQDYLQKKTATISIDSAEITDSQLDFNVSLVSLTGHKFPSGYPSRRVWLHTTVSDANDAILFESGAYESNGLIIENDNDKDKNIFEPHYISITAEDQVQIYETIMLGVQKSVTTELLLGASYAKDNRLLPRGFDKAIASPDIAVYGAAREDGDFTGAGDTVHYGIKLSDTSAPLKIKVELLYQSIGYRWAQNLGEAESPQISDFLRYYDETPNLPIVVASEEITITP